MEQGLTDLPVPVVQGEGCVSRIGAMAAGLGGTRAMLISDRGIAGVGHVQDAVTSLEAAGVAVAVFDRVHENPTTLDVTSCALMAKRHQADLLIGLGGGSSLDAAKGCNFIVTNGGEMKDYWGKEKATEPMLPFIAIPTTSGTGSECQRFAIISDPDTHQKMACGDVKALAQLAVLDPMLTLTQPRFVTACTGVDALSHAVEAAVTNVATPKSVRIAQDAFRLLFQNLPAIMRDPEDMKARAAMQIGAALAGAAIEYSMLGAAHSAANPLTARYDMVHGQAVGVMLPEVIRFNCEENGVAKRYHELMVHAGAAEADEDSREVAERLAEEIAELLVVAALYRPLSDFGAKRQDLVLLGREAEQQWTAQFNPRPVAAAEFEELYSNALA